MRAKTELKDLKQKLKFHLQILDAVQQAIIVTNTAAKIIYWNTYAEKLYGFKKEETIGKNILELISPIGQLSGNLENVYELATSKTIASEYTVKNKEGKIFPVSLSASPFYGENGEINGIVAIFVDISKQKYDEEALLIAKEKAEEQEKKFHALSENIQDYIMRYDKACRHTYMNKAALEIAGLQAHDIIGKTHREVGTFDEQQCEMWEENINKVFTTKQSYYEQFVFKGAHGEVFLDWRLFPEFNDNNEVVSVLGVSRDITELKRNELTIQQNNYRLKLLVELSQMTAKNNDEFYDFTLEKAIELSKSDSGFLCFLNEDEHVVNVHAKSSLKSENGTVKSRYQELDTVRKAILDEVINCRNSMIINNIDADMLSGEAASNGQIVFHNYLSIPVFEGQKVVLILTVGSNTIAYTNDDLKELSLLVDGVWNIVKQRKNEAALKSQKKLFETMFNTISDGVVITNINREIILANKGMKNTFGYEPQELIGKTTRCLYANEEQFKYTGSKVFNKNAKGDDKFYITYYKDKENNVFPGETFGAKLFDANGNWTGNVGIMRNISERQRLFDDLLTAKEKAEINEKRFRDLFDNMIDGFSVQEIIANKEGDVTDYRYLQMNAACEEILGIKAHETINKTHLELNPENADENWKSVFVPVALDRKPIKTEYFAPKFQKHLRITSFSPQKGQFANIFEDITDRKQMENELLIAKEKAEESDKLKTAFINNMSHEIRTPMNGILGFSKLLDKPNIDPSKLKHYVKIIKNSGYQLMRVIDDIIEISKLGTKQVKTIKEQFCLNDVLYSLFSIFDIRAKENKTPLYFKKGLSDKESTIFSDSSKINKIVSNLLENALKFTNSGIVEFGYALVSSEKTSPFGPDKKQELQIFVKDTGIGIAREKQEIIFERFAQAQKEGEKNVGGLGLGLSIARENAELLGGSISLKSEKGKGSTFFVNIPYIPVSKWPEQVNQANHDDENQHKYKVLVAEDEEVNFLYLETLLEEELEIACKVIHAKNGKEAVEICTKNKDIWLVLMDIKMPEMDGYQAAKKINEIRPNLPIVAQTAYSSIQDRDKAIAEGFADFISKPISVDILNKVINKFMLR